MCLALGWLSRVIWVKVKIGPELIIFDEFHPSWPVSKCFAWAGNYFWFGVTWGLDFDGVRVLAAWASVGVILGTPILLLLLHQASGLPGDLAEARRHHTGFEATLLCVFGAALFCPPLGSGSYEHRGQAHPNTRTHQETA